MTTALIDNLYKAAFGEPPSGIVKMAGAGSSRKYFRVSGNPDVVACVGDNGQEYRDFIALSRLFRSHGIAVPEIYACDDGNLISLQQDLGDSDLFSYIGKENFDGLAAAAFHGLAAMQTVDGKEWQPLASQTPFNSMRVMWDLNYFKYEFLKVAGLWFDEFALQRDFDNLAGSLTTLPASVCGFMYRDFQSRNVMVKDGNPYFIDYQSGMYGPCLYDAVSFLWQARANFSDEFRQKMLDVYAADFCKRRKISKEEFLAPLYKIVLLRTLQVLGAYGLRGLVERKAHFIESIPNALRNLNTLIGQGVLDDYPELKRVCRQAVTDPRFSGVKGDRLVIEISSFSYKKGYPANFTGNGGGFMFDCRALPNPGRYPQYARSTGRDRDVKEFFQLTTEMDHFLSNTMAVIDKAVKVYASRGFTHLQIGYGCTGGQHRSVYCAENVARNIAECIRLGKYPYKGDLPPVVHLIHREQGIDEYL